MWHQLTGKGGPLFMRQCLVGLEDALEQLKNVGFYLKAVVTMFFSGLSSAFRGAGK